MGRRAVFGLVLLLLGGATASADWRDTVKTLRVGFVAGPNPAYRAAQREPFRRYLEDRLGIPVQLVAAATTASLIEAQGHGRVQYAIYSASAFAAADAACSCVEVLALPRGPGGTLGYYAVMVARADGEVASLVTAEGTRLAYTKGPSIAGHLVPFAALAAEGAPPESFFGGLVAAGDPEAAMRALLAGEADVAIAWSSLSGNAAEGYDRGVFASLVRRGALAMGDIRVVWKSPLIPYGPHAIRTDMPRDLKVLLRQVLLEMDRRDGAALDAIDRENGIGFAVAPSGLYDAVKRIVGTPAVK